LKLFIDTIFMDFIATDLLQLQAMEDSNHTVVSSRTEALVMDNLATDLRPLLVTM
jgi:hypothetical protein